MKKMRRIGTALLILALALGALLGALLGAGQAARAEGSAALRIAYVHRDAESGTETAIAGAEFRLYKVATGAATQGLVPAEGFELTSAFADSGVGLAGPDQEAWREQALTLAGHVAQKDLTADASGTTDAAGNLSLATGLEPGLYLLLGERVEQDGYAYLATPALVAVQVEDQGKTLEIQPKHTRVPLDAEPITRKVLKVWNDAGVEKERPSEIEAQLLRDGAVVSTVTLNAANSWSYTWENLSATSEWLVAEKDVPAGYSVQTQLVGVTYTITNTAEPCLFDPPVKKIITGDTPDVKATFRFVMEAVSNTAGYTVANQPIPEGSVNGKKTHDLTGAGEFEFGNVCFMKPGTYVYRLYEDATTKAAGYTYDETEYTITAVVTEENGKLSAATTAQKKGEAVARPVALLGPEAYRFEFTNAYKRTTTPPATPTPTNGGGGKPSQLPQTGQVWWPIPILALVGLALVVIGAKGRKREDR